MKVVDIGFWPMQIKPWKLRFKVGFVKIYIYIYKDGLFYLFIDGKKYGKGNLEPLLL